MFIIAQFFYGHISGVSDYQSHHMTLDENIFLVKAKLLLKTSVEQHQKIQLTGINHESFQYL